MKYLLLSLSILTSIHLLGAKADVYINIYTNEAGAVFTRRGSMGPNDYVITDVDTNLVINTIKSVTSNEVNNILAPSDLICIYESDTQSITTNVFYPSPYAINELKYAYDKGSSATSNAYDNTIGLLEPPPLGGRNYELLISEFPVVDPGSDSKTNCISMFFGELSNTHKLYSNYPIESNVITITNVPKLVKIREPNTNTLVILVQDIEKN